MLLTQIGDNKQIVRSHRAADGFVLYMGQDSTRTLAREAELQHPTLCKRKLQL